MIEVYKQIKIKTMKTSFKLFAISLFTLLSVISTSVTKSQVSASVSFSVFHDNLQAYGRWVSHSRYGEVWIPRVSGFRPYSTGGHWTYTDFGWTWVSDYDWGWAPFHYGRWAYDPAYGWVWIPGYEWGPAWVSWRNSSDYYGWAPLGPDVSIGIGVSFGTTIPAERWVFVPSRYIVSPVVYRYYVPPARNVTIIKNTTIINNTRETNVFNQKTVVVGGPRREDVEKVAHTKVQVMHVNDATKPSREVVDRSRNTINVYRPVINKTTINKNVTVNKNTTNKNTTVNNDKEVNKTQTNKTTVNNNKKVTSESVNNNKTVNKEANRTKEANKTTAKKEATKKTAGKEVNDNNKNVSKNKKQVQKNAPPNTNKQNATRPAENGKPEENSRPVEKKPASKHNEHNEQQVHKPSNHDSDNNKPKKPQASVSSNDNSNSKVTDQSEMKTTDSKIKSEKNQNKKRK